MEAVGQADVWYWFEKFLRVWEIQKFLEACDVQEVRVKFLTQISSKRLAVDQDSIPGKKMLGDFLENLRCIHRSKNFFCLPSHDLADNLFLMLPIQILHESTKSISIIFKQLPLHSNNIFSHSLIDHYHASRRTNSRMTNTYGTSMNSFYNNYVEAVDNVMIKNFASCALGALGFILRVVKKALILRASDGINLFWYL